MFLTLKTEKQNGFTIIEVLITLSIISLLAYLAVVHFSSQRDNLTLQKAVEDLQGVMEEARAESLAGKGGEAQGVKFNNDSYVLFAGSSYSNSDPDNVTKTIDDKLSISTTLSGEETIVFNRLTGAIGSTATVTVAFKDDATKYKQIVVGKLGDVSLSE